MIVRTTKELGLLIRDHRRRRGLTQASLAELVGASRKWIVDLESGRTADLLLVLRALNALDLELEARPRARERGEDQVDVDRIIDRSTKAR